MRWAAMNGQVEIMKYLEGLGSDPTKEMDVRPISLIVSLSFHVWDRMEIS